MGRTIVYGLILVLSVFLLSSLLILKSGGGRTEAVSQVSIHELSAASEIYAGERVTTSGVLRSIASGSQEFFLEAEGLRVAVRGYDEETLAKLEGRRVTIRGRFDFEEKTGRLIEAESVTPLPN